MIDKKIIIIVVSFVFVIWLSGCINKATVDRHPTFKLESIESLHIRNSDGGGDETQEEMVNEVLTNIFGETKLANDGVQEEAIHVSPAENDAQMPTTTD